MADDEPAERNAKPPHREVHSCRFSPDEWQLVVDRATAAGFSPSRFQRMAALGAPLGRRVNNHAVVALNRLGVNLNTMLKISLRTGQMPAATELSQLLAELRQQLSNLLSEP